MRQRGEPLLDRAERIARTVQNFGWGSRGAFHHGGLSNDDVAVLARAYLALLKGRSE